MKQMSFTQIKMCRSTQTLYTVTEKGLIGGGGGTAVFFVTKN